MKQILVINTQSSLNDLSGKEGLDLALIFGAFEQDVTMVFTGGACTQVIANQSPESINQKDYLSTIKALGIYDIENVYVSSAALEKYQLSEKPLIEGVQIASQNDLNEMKQTANHVYII